MKLHFKVVHCSSEHAEFPVAELNIHSPHTQGWQSARMCDYPQEIVLQFNGARGRTRASRQPWACAARATHLHFAAPVTRTARQVWRG